MMTYQLSILAKQRPEILERILRVVRHRGFRVQAMTMESPSESLIKLDLTVTSDRALNLLITQLDKLMDVDSVNIPQQHS